MHMAKSPRTNMAALYDDSNGAIVLDPGSHHIHSGFAGDDAPRAVYPCVVGRPRGKVVFAEGESDAYVGDDVGGGKGGQRLFVSTPMEGGLVTNWDDMEKILHHNFYNELRVAPEEQPFLLAEPVMAPLRQREKFCELAFETFGVPCYATVMNCILDAYCSRRADALIVSVGETEGFVCGMTEDAEGEAFPGCRIIAPPVRIPVQGSQVTDHLLKLLSDRRGYSFTTAAEREIVRDIKERHCHVRWEELGEAEEETYELPDGQLVHLAEERHLASEALFNPSAVRETGPGVSDAVAEYIESCPPDLMDRLGANIVLAGGSTKLPNFQDRLSSDLHRRFQSTIYVVAHSERKVSRTHACGAFFVSRGIFSHPGRVFFWQFSTWIGGSLLASLPTFREYWMTKEHYDELGAEGVHAKFRGGVTQFSSGSLTKAARS
jgi:actin-related protein